MDSIHISWPNLFLGYLLLVIPIAVMWYYRTGLVRDTLVAAARMTIQLFLMGLYLTVLFELNLVWVNLLWLAVMIAVSAGTTIRRSHLSIRKFFLPVMAGTTVAIVIVDSFFLGITLQMDNIFDARYFITITGMIIGNAMKQNIIALNTFYHSLQQRKHEYRYCISNGASRNEALQPFMKEAVRKSFNPQIATMAVLGLIAMPGTLTGQILGGSSPETAIKYQIMLMLSIFIACMITIVVTIIIANRFLFDEYDDFSRFSPFSGRTPGQHPT
ncbi:MAG: ABC transporter permease [Bacteroidales bacterium]